MILTSILRRIFTYDSVLTFYFFHQTNLVIIPIDLKIDIETVTRPPSKWILAKYLAYIIQLNNGVLTTRMAINVTRKCTY